MGRAEWVQFVLAIGLGGIIVEALRSMSQRRKMGADAAKSITDATMALLRPLHERIEELEDELVEERQRFQAEMASARRDFEQQTAAMKQDLATARMELADARTELAEARRAVRELRESREWRNPHQ